MRLYRSPRIVVRIIRHNDDTYVHMFVENNGITDFAVAGRSRKKLLLSRSFQEDRRLRRAFPHRARLNRWQVTIAIFDAHWAMAGDL